MSIFQRLLGSSPAPVVERQEPPMTAAAETVTATDKAGWMFEGFGAGQSRVKTLPRVTPDIAQKHATVFACAQIIAGDLSKVPMLVVEETRRGTTVPVKEHDLDFLLNVESSPGISSNAMRMMTIYSFALRGNGHAYAPRRGSGDVELIEYVDPDQCQLMKKGRARFYDFIDAADVQRRVPARSMAHLRYLAADGWTGRSPLTFAAESMGIALAGQEAAARTVSGTHVRGYVKMADDFDDEETRLRGIAKIRNTLNNPDGLGWPVLGPDDEVHKLDLSAADQELLASRKFDREQIAAIYRMPPSKLQMLEYGVKANGQQQAIDYRTDCLSHWGALVQGGFEMGLLTEGERARRLRLVHDYDALMQATTKERYDAKSKAIGGPFMTVNEGRVGEGLEPLEGGDILYPPPNMTRKEGENKTSPDSDDDSDEGADE